MSGAAPAEIAIELDTPARPLAAVHLCECPDRAEAQGRAALDRAGRRRLAALGPLCPKARAAGRRPRRRADGRPPVPAGRVHEGR